MTCVEYTADLAAFTGVDSVMKAARSIAADSTENRVTVELYNEQTSTSSSSSSSLQ